jgi:hypothetical protein
VVTTVRFLPSTTAAFNAPSEKEYWSTSHLKNNGYGIFEISSRFTKSGCDWKGKVESKSRREAA